MEREDLKNIFFMQIKENESLKIEIEKCKLQINTLKAKMKSKPINQYILDRNQLIESLNSISYEVAIK